MREDGPGPQRRLRERLGEGDPGQAWPELELEGWPAVGSSPAGAGKRWQVPSIARMRQTTSWWWNSTGAVVVVSKVGDSGRALFRHIWKPDHDWLRKFSLVECSSSRQGTPVAGFWGPDQKHADQGDSSGEGQVHCRVIGFNRFLHVDGCHRGIRRVRDTFVAKGTR